MTGNPLRGTRLGRMVDQAVDLSEAKANGAGEPEPKGKALPGWNAGTRRLQAAGMNVELAVDSLGILTEPEAAELRERILTTLLPGMERRLARRLGLLRYLMRPRTRRRLAEELAGFSYGNAYTLAIMAVEAERERKGRRRTGHAR